MNNRKVNLLNEISGIMLYPLSIAVTYLLLTSYQLDNPPGVVWSSFFSMVVGFVVPSFFLVAAYQGQLWLWSKNYGGVPFRKFLASILGSVGIVIAHRTLNSEELSATQLLLALNVSFLALLVGTHPNLKDYLGVSGGLSEYGYPEL